ncbi:muts domain V-domain-containing protein [Lentinula raphanica]|nr:muts domain V-domain-containing protein [Lentinula raphanica]
MYSPTQPPRALPFFSSSASSPHRMVKLPSVYQGAKLVLANYSTLRYATAFTTARTIYTQPGENESFRRDQTEHPSEESASIADTASTSAPQTIKATKVKKRLSELPKFRVLPDGSIAKPLDEWQGGEDNLHSDGLPKSVLAREIRDNLSKFPHCLLLTRVGNFYESYFEQAIEISKILNIKLTSRRWGAGRVPMCGFPLMHVDKYLKIMVQQHKRFVAMCEEFPKHTPLGEREFERRVVRVITPGTLIDESFLNQYENNYLLAISIPSSAEEKVTGSSLGLAWIDVSTGEFYSKHSMYENLRDDIARIGPKEILLDDSLETQTSHPVMQAVTEESNVVSFVLPSRTDNEASGLAVQRTSSFPIPAEAQSIFPTDTSSSSEAANVTDEIVIGEDTSTTASFNYTPEETSAIDLLTNYLRANLLEHMPSLSLPSREDIGGRMQIDSHTIKALEIRESMREGGIRGSLMSSVKRTITTSGTRLLARWLCSPSTSIKEINARQSLVAFFYSRPHLRADLLALLVKAEDAGRIVQKFLVGKGDPSDMLALTTTVNVWSEIQRRIAHEREMECLEQPSFDTSEWMSLDTLMSRMVNLGALAKRISLAIEHPVNSQLDDSQVEDSENEGGYGPEANILRADSRYGRIKLGIKIKPEFSAALLELNNSLKDLWEQKAKLEEKLQLKYDAPSLTLRSSPGQGMHVHLAKAKRDQRKLHANSEFVSINETGTTRSYFFQDWAQLGQKIFTTSIAIADAEKEAFMTLRQEVNFQAPSLRRNARILDELDVTLAFAQLATDMNLVRPWMKEDATYNVVNGRHPTVELGLLTSGRTFTPNTVSLTPSSNFHVITGPNMAGKSTVLRQTALITILAQSGSFVPADAATLGVVDKLFSRVGAKDDLFHDRSTFMVEMLETAEILRRATPRSLVIMDEVGRGTTVKDGIALAFATIHHLLSVNRCRTLFATHFHELSEMLGYREGVPFGQGAFGNVAFHCTTLEEMENGMFSYSYRLRPGVNRDSHGLKVAQLAGMPQQAISVAQDVLIALNSNSTDANDLASIGRRLSLT